MTVKKNPIKKAPEVQETKKEESTPATEEAGESIAIMKLKTQAYNIISQIDNHNMQINQLRQQLQQVNEQVVRVTQQEARALRVRG